MDRIDSDGRLHRYLGRKRIPLFRWFPWLWRAVDVWRVELPSSRLLYLPAIRETGGGAEGTYYSSTDDGVVVCTNLDYETAHDAASGTSSNAVAAFIMVGQLHTGGEEPEYQIQRAVVFFNTSGIPLKAFVNSAVLGLYGESDESTTDFDLTVVEYTGTQPPDVADYDQFGAVSFGSLTTVGWSLVGYNNIALNEAGRRYISKTGITALGLRSSRDISTTMPPTGIEAVDAYSANEVGKEPKLTLVYYLPRGGVGVGNPMVFG